MIALQKKKNIKNQGLIVSSVAGATELVKLDTVRKLLRKENTTEAKKYGKVYILKPVAA